MVIRKRRAGLIVVGRSSTICLVLRMKPYESIVDTKIPDNDRPYHRTILPARGGGGGGGRHNQIMVAMSYEKAIVYRPNIAENMKRNQQHNGDWIEACVLFPERVQIPRGVAESGEDLLLASCREFFEETRCANDELHILDHPLVLEWRDGLRSWSYTIYVGLIKDNFKIARCFPKSGGGSGGGEHLNEKRKRREEYNYIQRCKSMNELHKITLLNDTRITNNKRRKNKTITVQSPPRSICTSSVITEDTIVNKSSTTRRPMIVDGFPLNNSRENVDKFVIFVHLKDYFQYLKHQMDLYSFSNYDTLENRVKFRLDYLRRVTRSVKNRETYYVSQEIPARCHVYKFLFDEKQQPNDKSPLSVRGLCED